jgi:hypothetical protein
MFKKGKVYVLFGDNHPDLWDDEHPVVFRIVSGWQIRPVAPLKRWGSKTYNVWKGAPYWFILKLPLVWFFFSLRIRGWGFYIGAKTYDIDIRDDIWTDQKYPYGEYLCFSARVYNG